MEQAPVGLIIASREDVLSHGHVLYGLVKQGEDQDSLESTSRMVNVVPPKRIYCMNSVDELMLFREELLKRPLVLQPVVQAGTGVQSLDCFFCVRKEPWVMMINQFHEKIMEKISIGMEKAKGCMFRGEPFVLEFAFGDILKRHYYGNISKYTSSKFAYIDCEYGDIVIRPSPNKSFDNKVMQLKYSFDDIEAEEIKVRTLQEAAKEKRSPVLEFIPQSELKELLSGWVFDEVEVEESIVSTSDYHSDTNAGATGGEDDVVTSQPQPRVKGRAQRKQNSNKYEVPVELHVPLDIYDKNYEVEQRQTQYNTDSDQDCEIRRFRHFHQGSGSGRSDSSNTDSGYGDVGCHDIQYSTKRNLTNYKEDHNVHKNNYDNYGFSDDLEDEGNDGRYGSDTVDTIITRTGKKTFTSHDMESLSARMMDESIM